MLEVMRVYIAVYTSIKIPRCKKVWLMFAVRAAKKVPVIEEKPIQFPVRTLLKNHLPVVRVLRANIDHPCQPKVVMFADELKAGSGEEFKESHSFAAQKSRPKTEARTRSTTSV